MFEQQKQAEPSEQAMAFDADLIMGVPCAESIALLLRTELESLDRDDGVAAAAGAEKAKRLLDAIQLRCLARAAGRRREPGELSDVGQELSAATNLAPRTGSCRTDLACSAVSRLPRTLGHLEAGRYTLRNVEDVERATRDLTDEQARQVDRQLPARPGRLKSRLAEAIAGIDPDHLNRKAEQARTGRGVDFWTDALDGTAGVGVHGPLAPVATIKAAIDTLAGHGGPGECRNLNQRRFDAVHDWARTVLGLPTSSITSPVPEGADGSTACPTADGHTSDSSSSRGVPGCCEACGRVVGSATIPINVTISLEALLRLSEAPGDLNGEPIPAEVARELAGDGRWHRWVFERATGRLLDVGATTYRPGAALDRFIRARDRTCTFPSCTIPAERCDLDHLDEYSKGGETIEANLGAKCRTHHRLKGELGWDTRRPPAGHTDWTAPSGRVYTQPAETHADDPALSAYLTRATAYRHAREQAQRQRIERQQATRDHHQRQQQARRQQQAERRQAKQPPTRPQRGQPPNRPATESGVGSPDSTSARPDAGSPDPWITPPNPHEEPPF